MRNFYTTFNFREEKVGIAVNASATYPGILIHSGPGFTIVIYLGAVVAIALLSVFIIVYYCRKAKQTQQQLDA